MESMRNRQQKRWARRNFTLALAIGALATSVLATNSALASESVAAESRASALQVSSENPAWRGVFCAPRSGSRWNRVAFAAVIIAVGWLARRDPIASS
jgi:hypothetical protein